MFSFQTLLKGTFSPLQFSITAKVCMTLKRQSVQRLSDHKTARTFCASQEHGIVERMSWTNSRGSRVQSRGRGSNVAAGENDLEFEVTE